MIHRALLLALAPLVLAATPATAQRSLLDGIAIDYVNLTLEIGEREPGYVDAYFGPPEMAAAAKANPRGVKALAAAAAALSAKLAAIAPSQLHPVEQRRRAYLLGQLKAAETRLAMLQGKKLKFVDEAEALFGVRPVLKPLGEYDAVLSKIEKLLPGTGPLASRVAAESGNFVIPTDKADAVMRAAIAECRARTFKHVTLPAKERFDLEFVKNQPWGGYNWYKGNNHSLIQINTDLPITIGRAIDLGCHEGYPGHHTYMSRLEETLVNGRGWIEFSVYPLYSPQSFIAEGSANAGIKLAFPGDQQAEFEARILYPLAGLPPAKAAKHDAVLKALEELKGASVTIQQMYLDGEIDRARAVELLGKYALSGPEFANKSLDFADRYRSYVINYGLGAEMVTTALESGGADEKTRWTRMQQILSEPTIPADLAR